MSYLNVVVKEVYCDAPGCEATDSDTGVPVETIRRDLAKQGWTHRRRGSQDFCPAHS